MPLVSTLIGSGARASACDRAAAVSSSAKRVHARAARKLDVMAAAGDSAQGVRRRGLQQADDAGVQARPARQVCFLRRKHAQEL